MVKSKKKRISKKRGMRKNKSLKMRNLYVGGCGCDKSNNLQLMTGGYGQTSLQPIPLNKFYEFNVNDQPIPVSARMLPDVKTGGKKRKDKRNRSVSKGKRIVKIQMNGGNAIPLQPNNVVAYTGTSQGSFLSRDLLSGASFLDSSPTNQPILNINRNVLV